MLEADYTNGHMNVHVEDCMCVSRFSFPPPLFPQAPLLLPLPPHHLHIRVDLEDVATLGARLGVAARTIKRELAGDDVTAAAEV